MKIAVVGTGYVGLVAGVCFADAGHNVVCVDKDVNKINKLLNGELPIYEPGLDDLLLTAKRRLEFTTDLPKSVRENDVIFVAVETPEKEDGSANLEPTRRVVNEICTAANGPKFMVLKSTVPVGTARMVRMLCNELTKYPIEVISNPEFLKEGAAVDDFLKPDRVVVGCASAKAEAVMREVYEPFTKQGHPILFMDNTSAEMTKYAANAFLSVKISFINELALLADKLGADINEVRRGFTTDRRINPAFFSPGVGFGGSCFPKDVNALVYTGRQAGVPMAVVDAANEVNQRQKLVLFERICEFFNTRNLAGKTIAIWGLAFKPRTDDVREAPALYLIEKLVGAGAKVRAYDPIASETARAASKVNFEIGSNAMDVAEGADALAILTEWNEFLSPDLPKLHHLLKTPAVFDGRNVFDPIKMQQLGFHYFCIGRQSLANREMRNPSSANLDKI